MMTATLFLLGLGGLVWMVRGAFSRPAPLVGDRYGRGENARHALTVLGRLAAIAAGGALALVGLPLVVSLVGGWLS